MKTRHLFLGLLTCLACQAGYAKETNVNVNTLTSEFDQAADQDVLLLESGIYSSQLSFPAGKTPQEMIDAITAQIVSQRENR